MKNVIICVKYLYLMIKNHKKTNVYTIKNQNCTFIKYLINTTKVIYKAL